jgi:hypothetical protein
LQIKAQTFKIVSDINNDYSVSAPPELSISYVFTTNLNIAGCKYKWEPSNAKYYSPGGSTLTLSNTNSFTWENVNGNASVKVTLKECNNSSSTDESATYSVPIRYLGDPGNIKINGTAHSGSYSLACGTNQITLSVDAATNADVYEWTYPPNWSGPSTGNPVSVTPHINTSGVIKVKAKRNDVPNFSTEKTLTITRPTNNPSISSLSQYEWITCSSGSTLSVSASGQNNDSFRWYPQNGVRVNGQTSVVTTSSAVSISAVSSGTYLVKAYSAACNVESSNSLYGDVHYGPPVITSATVNGGPLQYPNYVSNGAILNIAHKGGTSCSWSITNGNGYLYPTSFSANATPNPFVQIFAQTSNSCGNGDTRTFYLQDANSFLYSVAPNPTTDKVVKVKFSDKAVVKELLKEAVLYDESQTVLAKLDIKRAAEEGKDEVELDATGAKQGVHYLHLTIGEVTYKERILIE